MGLPFGRRVQIPRESGNVDVDAESRRGRTEELVQAKAVQEREERDDALKRSIGKRERAYSTVAQVRLGLRLGQVDVLGGASKNRR
jgi:hypothetical protein